MPWFYGCTCNCHEVLKQVLSLQSIMEYEEHEKRAWSVDFSRTEPSMLVSGSDDGKVCFSAVPQTFTYEFATNLRLFFFKWKVLGYLVSSFLSALLD